MVRCKIQLKTDIAASGHVTFLKRLEELFMEARELAILCDADVAITIFSSNGKIPEFATSDMQRILARFHYRLKSSNLSALEFNPEVYQLQTLPALEFNPEGPEEHVSEGVDVQKLLDKDLTHMDLDELLVREEQLNEVLLCINDRKMQIIKEQFEQCRMQEQQVLQENQTLQRQVEELQGFFPSTSYAVPQSVYFPEKECNVGPADKEFFPSTSFAAPLASADKDSDITLALAPTRGWLKMKTSESETYSSNHHTQVGRR